MARRHCGGLGRVPTCYRLAPTAIPREPVFIGAMALDVAIYEEVEADRGATTQAFAVVLLSSLAAGFGARGLGENSLPNIAILPNSLPGRLVRFAEL